MGAPNRTQVPVPDITPRDGGGGKGNESGRMRLESSISDRDVGHFVRDTHVSRSVSFRRSEGRKRETDKEDGP